MRVRAVFASLAAAAVLVAGCTKDDPAVMPTVRFTGMANLSADEIMDAAITTLVEAESFRMILGPGSGFWGTPFDLVYAGENVAGTVPEGQGSDVELVKVGDALYFMADTTYWDANLVFFADLEWDDERFPAIVAELNGLWVEVPAGYGLDVFAYLTAESLFTEARVARPLTKGATAIIDGILVVEIIDAEQRVFSVALEGEPYIVKITEGWAITTFTEIGEPVEITAPTSSVDLFEMLEEQGVARR